jgi:hypothetical protein
MVLLDPHREKWYCYKDDQIWLAVEKRWVEKEDSIRGFNRLSKELRQNLLKYFSTLYIDGYANFEVGEAFIYIFENYLRVSIGAPKPTVEFNLKYDAIKSLLVTQEREITSLRTFLLGAVLAASFKKTTLILNMSFTDSLGLLQSPSFKLAKDDLDECYQLIIERIAKAKGAGLRIADEQTKHYTDFVMPNRSL